MLRYGGPILVERWQLNHLTLNTGKRKKRLVVDFKKETPCTNTSIQGWF